MYQPIHRHNKSTGFGANLFSVLAILLLTGVAPLSHALESDRFQPIDVAADSAILDDKAGKAIYRGNVELTQGSLKINADQLTIEAGAQGKVEKVIATGDLARFEQIPNENDKPIEARANTVEYYVASEKVVLIENARVVQNNNLFEGNIIEYDIKAQKLQAHGKTLTAEGENQEQPGRVKMVLQPQTETDNNPNAESPADDAAPREPATDTGALPDAALPDAALPDTAPQSTTPNTTEEVPQHNE